MSNDAMTFLKRFLHSLRSVEMTAGTMRSVEMTAGTMRSVEMTAGTICSVEMTVSDYQNNDN